MNNLFFWIIVLSFLIPMGMRMYRKSVQRRNQDQSYSGRYPDQFPGGPSGPQSKQPRDGYTQQDYFGGGFRQIGGRQPLPPLNQPNQDFQPYQDFDPNQRPQPEQPEQPQQAAAPATPPPPSEPQGFRARKLAELDTKYSNGELAMEDYMAMRAEIMKG
ncbi:hypothetical protein [Pseudarthrobacter sp. N5]|uniref:hypothetical protein n=1 Tax=Pseudarthrobacter sp. N5 TaxID=3418416 RepID=UPI003CF776D0